MKIRLLTTISAIAITAITAMTAPAAHATGMNIQKYANGTVCRYYDSYINIGSGIDHDQPGTLCVAPSTAYPNYKGWSGRVTTGDTITGSSSPCGFSLFPYDSDDPIPAIACAAVMPAPIPAYKWTSTGWQNHGLTPNAHGRAYVAPFGGSWRWVYAEGAWHAVQAKYVAIVWFTAR